MNENKNRAIGQIEELIKAEGITLAELVKYVSGPKSSLLYLSDSQQAQFNEFFSKLECVNCTKQEKGKYLENLSDILFDRGLFHVLKNCRTSSNELDILVEWSQDARLSSMHTAFPFLGETFICECKNYTHPVSVTYVGKFFSLLVASGEKFGIMISWNGVTARSPWSDALGLIKKIALKEGIFIIVIDRVDLQRICNKETNLFSLLSDKYNALKNDIDYSAWISKHEAEGQLTCPLE